MPLSNLEAFYAAGSYAAAKREFRRLLAEEPGGPVEQEARLYYLGALIHLRLNEHFAAARLIRLAEEKAGLSGLSEAEGRCRYFSGVILGEVGDSALAKDCYIRFLTDLDKYPELGGYAGLAHYGLGLVYAQRNEPLESINHYLKAIPLIESTNKPEYLLRALHNTAWALYDMDRLDEGDRHMDRGESLVRELENEALRVAHKLTRAYGQFRRGNPVEAVALCEEVLTPGVGASEESHGWATWICAECAAKVGRHDDAVLLARMALDLSIKTRQVRLMNYASRTRKRIELDEGGS